MSVVVERVQRRFGDNVVLDGLDLELAASEFAVLLGPSGCGKSTLLRLLAGLDRPDAGRVERRRPHGPSCSRTRGCCRGSGSGAT